MYHDSDCIKQSQKIHKTEKFYNHDRVNDMKKNYRRYIIQNLLFIFKISIHNKFLPSWRFNKILFKI